MSEGTHKSCSGDLIMLLSLGLLSTWHGVIDGGDEWLLTTDYRVLAEHHSNALMVSSRHGGIS